MGALSWDRCVVVSLAFFSIISGVCPQSVPKVPAGNDGISGEVRLGRKVIRMRVQDDASYCESWMFTVEVNDPGVWSTVPSRCVLFVKKYMTGGRYLSDSEFVAADSLAFAKNVSIAGDGKDCWVFDIDETLLSNLPYYKDHGFGSETYNDTSFNEWVEQAVAPALPASLTLYNELQKLDFTIILLTGRSEPHRNVTVQNLLFAGFTNWKELLLRGESDEGKPAIVFKSEKRQELLAEGYRIHGSSGDQWSDLLGYAMAQRSFKLPNPMYYIS